MQKRKITVSLFGLTLIFFRIKLIFGRLTCFGMKNHNCFYRYALCFREILNTCKELNCPSGIFWRSFVSPCLLWSGTSGACFNWIVKWPPAYLKFVSYVHVHVPSFVLDAREKSTCHEIPAVANLWLRNCSMPPPPLVWVSLRERYWAFCTANPSTRSLHCAMILNHTIAYWYTFFLEANHC